MGDNVIGRVELLVVVGIGEHRHGAVVLVAHHPASEMLAAHLAALEVKRVAVGIVGRRAEDTDPTVVLRPSHLPIVRDVAPHQITALSAPGRTFGPQHPRIEAFDLGVGLREVVKRRIDRDDIGIPEIGGRGAVGSEVARRAGDRRRRPHLAGLLGQRAAGPEHGGTGGVGRGPTFVVRLSCRIALHVCRHLQSIRRPVDPAKQPRAEVTGSAQVARAAFGRV